MSTTASESFSAKLSTIVKAASCVVIDGEVPATKSFLPGRVVFDFHYGDLTFNDAEVIVVEGRTSLKTHKTGHIAVLQFFMQRPIELSDLVAARLKG